MPSGGENEGFCDELLVVLGVHSLRKIGNHCCRKLLYKHLPWSIQVCCQIIPFITCLGLGGNEVMIVSCFLYFSLLFKNKSVYLAIRFFNQTHKCSTSHLFSLLGFSFIFLKIFLSLGSNFFEASIHPIICVIFCFLQIFKDILLYSKPTLKLTFLPCHASKSYLITLVFCENIFGMLDIVSLFASAKYIHLL